MNTKAALARFFLPDELAREPAHLRWEPLRAGVEVAWLYREPDDGPAAAYLRYAPGARVPAHEHTGYETVLVIAGTQSDGRGRYPAGTLAVNPPGRRHAVWSDEGCTVLIIWERQARFLLPTDALAGGAASA